MIRITKTSFAMTTLKLDGRLSGEETPELLHICQGIVVPFLIDLSDLQFIDEEGAKVLLGLKAKGVRLFGARPYVSALLGAEEEG